MVLLLLPMNASAGPCNSRRAGGHSLVLVIVRREGGYSLVIISQARAPRGLAAVVDHLRQRNTPARTAIFSLKHHAGRREGRRNRRKLDAETAVKAMLHARPHSVRGVAVARAGASVRVSARQRRCAIRVPCDSVSPDAGNIKRSAQVGPVPTPGERSAHGRTRASSPAFKTIKREARFSLLILKGKCAWRLCARPQAGKAAPVEAVDRLR